jgi:hypothetical protein
MAGVCKNQSGQRAFNPRKSAGNINGMSSFPADYADFSRRFTQKDFMAGVCKNQRGQRAFNPRKSAKI